MILARQTSYEFSIFSFVYHGLLTSGRKASRAAKKSQMLSRVIISAVTGIAAFVTLQPNAFAMSVKFSWKGYQPCSSSSPAFIVSEVPTDTVRLAFKMVDKDVPSYPHGGGIIAYTDKSEIPAGAFSYKGPCPPKGQQHFYQWTVQALDRNGKVVAATTVVENFPPH